FRLRPFSSETSSVRRSRINSPEHSAIQPRRSSERCASDSARALPENWNRNELHRVVLTPESRGEKKEAQNLRIGLCRPSREQIEEEENAYSSREAAQQVERRSAEAHGEKEEFSLRAENREWVRK